ncbi:MAG: protein-glutamate O-methyltransferase CheR [Pseudomonadota bacterium]
MIPPDDFLYLSKLLKEQSGLALTADKSYLLTARLKPIIEANELGTISALVKALKGGKKSLADDVVDAMTTNESLFFRDRRPFDALVATMLPTLHAARPRGRPIRIWCAAASTGQEPYSIAMLLEDNAATFAGRSVEIVASDLSRAALGRARRGEYTAFEVGRGMPKDVLQRHFTKLPNGHHLLSDKVRNRVRFQTRNLLQPFTDIGQVDIVFCRNVLIYFDRPTKSDVLNRIASLLAGDGYLVLGGPETTLGLTDRFARHADGRNVYIRSDGEGAAPRPPFPLGTTRPRDMAVRTG